MKALLLNLQTFDFVEEKTGQRIKGGNLHYITDDTDDNMNVVGYVVCKLFVTEEKIKALDLDKLKGSCYADLDIQVSLSGYGKLKPSLKAVTPISDFALASFEKTDKKAS